MNEFDEFANRRPSVATLSTDERELIWRRVMGIDHPAAADSDVDATDPEFARVTTIESARGTERRPHRLLGVAAAIAVLALGLTAMLIGRRTSHTSTSAATPHQQAPAVAPTGPLLTAPVPAISDPMILPSEPGWQMTNAWAEWMAPAQQPAFHRAVALVGTGPTFDAPLFAAAVAVTPDIQSPTAGTVPSIEALLTYGDPVQVAGTTGAVTVRDVDEDSGLPGPIVTLYWPLDAGHHAVVNGLRLSVDQVVAMANQLTYDGTTLTMPVPDGFRSIPLDPLPADRRYLSYSFEQGAKRFEVVGANGGANSLLSFVTGEIRTTRVIDGVETAVRADKVGGHIRIAWLSGEWAFYVLADGFASVDEAVATLSSLNLVDAPTFEAAGAALDMVMPGDHRDLAARVLTRAPLSDEAIAAAGDVQMATSADSYGVQLFQGAACLWSAQLQRALEADDEQLLANTIADIQLSVDRNAGTPFERAAAIQMNPLIEIANPHDAAASTAFGECPTWAVNR